MDMEQDTTFYTATMARVLAGQGRHAEAARIYRHLLEISPDDPELAAALAQASARAGEAAPSWSRAAAAVEKWVQLLMTQQALDRFRRIGSGLAAMRKDGPR